MYRVVVADSRTARNGRAIEEIGIYQPKEDPSVIRIDADRVAYWLGVGAQATEPVVALLKLTGDWQKFKGLPGAEGTLRVAEVKVDKNTKFAETVKAVANEPRTPTIRPKVEKVEEVPVAKAPAEEVVKESAAVEESVVEESAAVEAAVEPAVVEATPEVATPEVTEPPVADEEVTPETTEEPKEG